MDNTLSYGSAACLWDFHTCPEPIGTNTTPPINIWYDPFTQWMNWQDRAATQGECLAKDPGRFGCRLPGASQQMNFDVSFDVKFLYNESDCECLGGVPEAMYSWTPGVWQTGTPRPLTWLAPADVARYEWRNSTSFFLLESWVAGSVEQDVIAQLKSQLVCEENVIANSLSTLVCDCLAPDSPRGGGRKERRRCCVGFACCVDFACCVGFAYIYFSFFFL